MYRTVNGCPVRTPLGIVQGLAGQLQPDQQIQVREEKLEVSHFPGLLKDLPFNG